jgi:hypothetical protein
VVAGLGFPVGSRRGEGSMAGGVEGGWSGKPKVVR